MNLSSEILSQITVHMKYARHLSDKKRRETWKELVTRNKNMHLKKFPQIAEEIEDAYSLVYQKKVLPSMRALQFGGKPITLSPNRQYNCAFTSINHWEVFSEIMFLLLGGSGVGYSIQKHHVEQLPEIRTQLTRQRRFLIADSIEGWADAVKHLIKSYFFGLSKPNFDFCDIRDKGTPLITSGGTAPGPQPLKDCLHNLDKILNAKEPGTKLIPLECHDIICYIADAVLAGGIRRAALISLFSMDDEQMLTCKYGQWFEMNPQRGRANNSAVILRHKITKKKFLKFWERIKESGTGEPGIYFTNDREWGCNPCGEIALRSNQFCVAGSTKLLTKKGISTIANEVGNEIEIWNGSQWSLVTPYKTGDTDDLYRVSFNDGSTLDVTANHKFLAKLPWQDNFTEWDTSELLTKIQHLTNTVNNLKFQLPRANIVLPENIGIHEEFAYEYGFFLGDGHIDNTQLKANLYAQDKRLGLRGRQMPRDYFNWNGTHYLQIDLQNLDFNFGTELKAPNGLPSVIFSWTKKSILQFLGGWADSDGSQANKGCRIYGNEDNIRTGQLLLTKVGINSSVNLMEDAGIYTNLGIRRHAVWYLQIPNAQGIKSRRLDLFQGVDPPAKGKYQLIDSIKKLPNQHKSFCLTEEKLHQCVFNNVLTKQCNLTTINVSDVVDQADFNRRAATAAFIGTLQASYTDFHYIRDIWQRNTEKDSLLGVSMTGIASGTVFECDLTEAAEIVVEENHRVASKLGLKPAARCTCIKPEGTSSLVLGCSSGVHAWFAKIYVRRIRVLKTEAIYKYLKRKLPQLIEDDYFKKGTQAIISIPIMAPEGSIFSDEPAMDLLERIKKINIEWVKPGHDRGENTHNVSATVTVGENEWDIVGKWMWENRKHYNGLTVLPKNCGSYKQAPFETITEEQFKEMYKLLCKIDLKKVAEEDDNTNLKDQVACSGGACETSF